LGTDPPECLRRTGKLWQLREYVVHCSLYHLKEADPQAWVVPRISGPAKAALVTVEHDEYGSGHPTSLLFGLEGYAKPDYCQLGPLF
jgi:hypothetical protein